MQTERRSRKRSRRKRRRENSIPPVVAKAAQAVAGSAMPAIVVEDLTATDVEAGFFAAGDAPAPAPVDDGWDSLAPEEAPRKAEPARAHPRRRGAIVIVAASGLCLAAIAWRVAGRSQKTPAVETALVASAAPAPQPIVKAPAVAAVAAPVAPQPAAPEPVAVKPAAPEVPAAQPAPKAVAPKPPETEPAATASADTARTAKKEALRAFERGDVKTALAAGQRAIQLDPSDAEAWLVVGAAQQQRGDDALARRTFRDCVKQARRGPRGECAALAR